MTKLTQKTKQDRIAEKIRRVLRHMIIMLHDAMCGAFSYWFAAALILPLHRFAADVSIIIPVAAMAGILSVSISASLGVFSTRWRLASLTDFIALIKSASILMLVLFVLRAIYHIKYPEPFIVAELRIICLGSIFVLGSQAAGRIAFRYYHFLRRKGAMRMPNDATIFVGSASDAENALRAADQGILNSNIVACLLRVGDPAGKQIRGRPVLGTADNLDHAFNIIAAGGQNVTSLLLGPSVLAQSSSAQQLKRSARRLGLTLLKIETVGLGGRTEIRFEDFLFRARRHIDHQIIDNFVSGKSVLITGGGGSIGGDIALRVAAHGAATVTLLDIAELGLQRRAAQLRQESPQTLVKLVICDIRDRGRLIQRVSEFQPDVMIHAAALKHVDLVEQNWQEAIRTNVFGTLNAIDAADHACVPTLVNISTDKAADPVGMLGFTKRAGEVLVAQRSSVSTQRRYSVRFGNVLGSSGSVVEVFLGQISAGGPMTLTDPRVTRYFMSRDEAAELVLATGSLKDRSGLYLLDMGEPIAIRDLAIEMIEWAGLVPDKDIKIVETGLRPGERLTEQLVGADEILEKSEVQGISCVRSQFVAPINWAALEKAVNSDDRGMACDILQLYAVREPT
jgi:O-antigen biosynthesis protein WbqV